LPDCRKFLVASTHEAVEKSETRSNGFSRTPGSPGLTHPFDADFDTLKTAIYQIIRAIREIYYSSKYNTYILYVHMHLQKKNATLIQVS